MIKIRLALLLSLFAHLCWILAAGVMVANMMQGDNSNNSVAGKGPGLNGFDVDVIEIEEKKQVDKPKDVLTQDESPVEIVKEEKIEEEKPADCPGAWYGGVGVQVSYVEAHGVGIKITSVYKGYPAYKAGIQVGDIIIENEDGDLLGPPGTIVRVIVLRGGVQIPLVIIRGRICY